uniref:Uncharacterized protein n=1 Tax=Acanthochromis polyacanthus TaxID=80966 RepID=A0A3Q1FFR5_9TELE
MRIPPVTVAPTSLVHCQDKGLGVAPPFAQQLHQPSPHPQHHQAAIDRDRSPSRSSRPSRPPSRKGSSTNNNTSSTSTSGASNVSSYKRPCLENGHPPGHLYLPQNDYLNHSLAYANRYLHYPIPEGMALHSVPIGGKGPVYPHPVLLGSSSLYPTHLAAKPPLPYHNLPAGPTGEYLTYNTQEMVHPLMQTHSDNKLPDRADAMLKPRGQEKSRGAVDECGSHRDHNTGKETGEGNQMNNQNLTKTDYESKHQHHLPHPYPVHSGQSPNLKPSHTDRQPEISFGKTKVLQDTGCPGVTPCTSLTSPGQAAQAEEKTEKENSIVDLGESQGEGDDEEEEEGCQNSSKSARRSSLAKRIANSSGYVGDRFKCVTTELYADSSKLSREQRALQVRPATLVYVCVCVCVILYIYTICWTEVGGGLERGHYDQPSLYADISNILSILTSTQE